MFEILNTIVSIVLLFCFSYSSILKIISSALVLSNALSLYLSVIILLKLTYCAVNNKTAISINNTVFPLSYTSNCIKANIKVIPMIDANA